MRPDPVCGSQTRCDALDLWLAGCLCRLFDLAFFGVCGDLSRTTAVSGFGQENTAQLS